MIVLQCWFVFFQYYLLSIFRPVQYGLIGVNGEAAVQAVEEGSRVGTENVFFLRMLLAVLENLQKLEIVTGTSALSGPIGQTGQSAQLAVVVEQRPRCENVFCLMFVELFSVPDQTSLQSHVMKSHVLF